MALSPTRRKQAVAEDRALYEQGLPMLDVKNPALLEILQMKRNAYDEQKAFTQQQHDNWVVMGSPGVSTAPKSTTLTSLPPLPELNTSPPPANAGPTPGNKPYEGGGQIGVQPAPSNPVGGTPTTGGGGSGPFNSKLPSLNGGDLYQAGSFNPEQLNVGANPYAQMISGLASNLQNIGNSQQLSYNTAANRIRERSTADTMSALNSVSNRNLSRGMGNSGINDRQQIQAATAVDQNTANSLAGLEQAFAQLGLQEMGQRIGALNSAAGIGMGLGQDELARQSLGAQGLMANNSILASLFGQQEGLRFNANQSAMNFNEDARMARENNLLNLLMSTNQLNTQRDIANLTSQTDINQQFINQVLNGLFS